MSTMHKVTPSLPFIAVPIPINVLNNLPLVPLITELFPLSLFHT